MEKISFRKPIAGEIYCCTVKQFKKVWGERDIGVCFGTVGKSFKRDQHEPRRSENVKKIKGRIICHLFIHHRGANSDSDALIVFYPFAEDEYSSELEKEFSTVTLPEIKKWYCKYKDNINFGRYQLLVELDKKEIKLHEYFSA